MPFFALLDDAAAGRAVLYENHVRSEFLTADALDTLDSLLQQGWHSGLHAVLCAGYAFGLPLQQLPPAETSHLVLHWFAERRETDAESWLQAQQAGGPAGISAPESSTDEAGYLKAVRDIQSAIARGDTYQINYTVRLHLTAYGHPAELYRRLRQPVPYAALACLPDTEGRAAWTLCFSPELFLRIGSDGLISTEPMKGTAPVLNDGLDEQRARTLQADPKNRAENVMIVDLLRNDLGKIAETGKVRVPEPFKVTRFGSVWQMTSLIEAQARAHIRAADIFRAAFPCGSITGAPKRMSMQIIGKLETEPRGLYTGSIGFLEPCSGGLGFYGTLNVVIRTLSLAERSDGLFQGVYGVGSGIVADSAPEHEYAECRWKARFLSSLTPGFGIFETMRTENRRCPLLPLHLGRLKTSAAALNLQLPENFAERAESYIRALPDGLYRVKAALTVSDGLVFSHAPFADFSTPQYAVIHPAVLPPRDYLRRFKTDRRAVFDEAWRHAETEGAFDGLLFDSDGFLLEGGRSNVFIRTGGQWHTPAPDSDILNGVMRQTVLAEPQKYLGAEHVSESRIDRAMLEAADEIRLSNALRGLFTVGLKR